MSGLKRAGRRVRHAARSVLSAKGRSALLLAVLAFSSFSVTAVAGLHRGVAIQTARLIDAWGSDCHRLSSNTRWSRSPEGQWISIDSLDLEDVRALESVLGDRVRVTPYTGGRVVELTFGGQRVEGDLLGIENEYLSLQGWRLEAGEPFREVDSAALEQVVILGASVARALGSREVIGKSVRLGAAPFRVIGILSPRGAGVLGEDQDRRIFVPRDVAAKRIFSSSGVRGMLIVPRKPMAGMELAEALSRALEQRGHHLSGPNQDAHLTGPEWLRDRYRGSFSTVLKAGKVLVGCVALLAAVVVSSGLYLSVTERSAEIGLKRALGGTRRDLATEILFESAGLGVLGALLGGSVSWAGSRAVTSATEIAEGFSRYPVNVSAGMVVMVGGITVLIALGAALGPAWRAASIAPAETLRSE